MKKALKYTGAIVILAIVSAWSITRTTHKTAIMNETIPAETPAIDHTKKSILARGCDPMMSLRASKSIPPLIGNPEYVPTTDDVDFIEKLKSRKWSVIFFAPGACRYSAAKRPIPGSGDNTEGWTLEQYRELVIKLQGDDVEIVETMDERETVQLLTDALNKARETK